MKNKQITLLTNIFILGISLFSHVTYTGIIVFLQNNYKSPITGQGMTLNYKVSSAQPEGKYIGYNVRVSLGDIDFLPELSIRETGTGSSWVSYYHPLNYFLTDIKNQQIKHANDDAIIIVGPNSTLTTWDVKLAWEPKNKSIKPFEFSEFNKPEPKGVPKVQPVTPQPITQPAITMDIDQLLKELELMDATTAEGRLTLIKKGNLGPDYARKVTEICSANYAQAERLGKINLCSRLKTELLATKFGIVNLETKRMKELIAEERSKGKKIVVAPADLAPAIEDIKASINRIHNALVGYKTRGEAS